MIKSKGLTALAVLAVAILMVPGVSRAVTERQKPLAGMNGVGVWINLTVPQDECQGLTREQLQADVELKLRSAGIRVLTEKEEIEAQRIPYLELDVYVSIDLNPSLRPPYVPYSLKIVLLEWVSFERRFKDTSTLWFADFSWEVGPGDMRRIRDGVSHYVNQFIHDYLAANPKKDSRPKNPHALLLADAAKMMEDGWKHFNDGQQMVLKGVEMNNLVAAQMRFQDKMAPGNKVIKDGVNTAAQGATLIAQGLKSFLDHKDTPSVAQKGIDMMREGFKIAQNGKAILEKGVLMNNQVAREAGAMDKFAEGNQVLQTGMQTMAGGVKLFLQGEALYLKNK